MFIWKKARKNRNLIRERYSLVDSILAKIAEQDWSALKPNLQVSVFGKFGKYKGLVVSVHEEEFGRFAFKDVTVRFSLQDRPGAEEDIFIISN